MAINREAQLKILKFLSSHYPEPADLQDGGQIGMAIDQEFQFQLVYLQQHGLLEGTWSFALGARKTVIQATITARGLDFLEDDGGLSAILGVVTIKLHDETLKALIAEKIQASDLPAPEKKRFLDQLRELPAEATKHLVMKLLDLGLDQGPVAIAAIRTAVTSLLG